MGCIRSWLWCVGDRLSLQSDVAKEVLLISQPLQIVMRDWTDGNEHLHSLLVLMLSHYRRIRAIDWVCEVHSLCL